MYDNMDKYYASKVYLAVGQPYYDYKSSKDKGYHPEDCYKYKFNAQIYYDTLSKNRKNLKKEIYDTVEVEHKKYEESPEKF